MKLLVKLSDGSEDVYEVDKGGHLKHEVEEDGGLKVTKTVSLPATRIDRETRKPLVPEENSPIEVAVESAYYRPSGWLRWRAIPYT